MILYLLLLSFFNTTTSSEFCFDSSCSIGYQIIRFPFRIENRQLKPCGYPGFDLSCHATGQPILHLPSYGDFSVQYIDYPNQEILINDPKNCLPKRILSLNLSGSPFARKYSQDYTFFICSVNDQLPYDLKLNPIECLSNSSRTVFASSIPIFVDILSTSCVVMKTVSVPVSLSFSLDLRDDLRLKWEKPDCKKCESDGGRCGLIPNSSHAIQCTNNPYSQPQNKHGSGMPSGAIYGLCIAVGVPSSLCLLGFICCLYARVRSHSRPRNSSTEAHWTLLGPQSIPVPNLCWAKA